MAVSDRPATSPEERRRAQRRVFAGAAAFFLVGLVLQLWRLEVLQASLDQGIFLQVLSNGLRALLIRDTEVTFATACANVQVGYFDDPAGSAHTLAKAWHYWQL